MDLSEWTTAAEMPTIAAERRRTMSAGESPVIRLVLCL
jgi:hypothetical protein